MLKDRIKRKIYISTAALFTVFLLCLVPNKYDLNIDKDIIVNSNIKTINVYLLSKDNLLSRVNVPISSTSKEEEAREIIKIISDSEFQSVIPSGFRKVLPEVKINNLYIKDKIINIDFTPSLFDIPKDKEELVIESLVFSLTEIEDIDGITIYINGNILEYLPLSKKKVPNILTREYGINKKYDLTSLDNVNNVTTYYTIKENDKYYYVPVTKYINDNREKIDIVIDELTSNNIYNTNLMSFLDSNTKLLEVQKIEDILYLSFNNYIFNDFDKKTILEEVIYTICLSIKDNYDVKEVVFTNFDEEIYKTALKTIE